MSVAVVVGGQYGSEGKGKVALEYTRKEGMDIAIKVGGRNSGHTAYKNGEKYIFKVLPTGILCDGVTGVIPSGAYFSVDDFLREKKLADLSDKYIKIDPYSVIIDEDMISEELHDGLIQKIGSTGSGTGEAVIKRIKRNNKIKFAKDIDVLQPYLENTKKYLREQIDKQKKLIIEGTQGYGLSLLHSNEYPFVTSRDTTAASVISEVGLSPLDITEIILVIRTFPIRVAGNSGNLKNELNWEKVAELAGTSKDLTEYTSVTNKVRRVASFDEEIVKSAIMVNQPTKIVLNHVDYIDNTVYDSGEMTSKVKKFIEEIEGKIKRKIDYIGTNPYTYFEQWLSINRRG